MTRNLGLILPEEIIKKLPKWHLIKNNSYIRRELVFTDFKAAIAFMNKVAALAEEINHHPEWFNVYNKVNVELSTHDKGGITNLDIQMAQFIDNLCP